jgi:hypothetical protein
MGPSKEVAGRPASVDRRCAQAAAGAEAATSSRRELNSSICLATLWRSTALAVKSTILSANLPTPCGGRLALREADEGNKNALATATIKNAEKQFIIATSIKGKRHNEKLHLLNAKP